MRNGRSDDCDGFDVAFCRFDRLLDCLGYFGCLTGADTYAALFVADDDKRGETHSAAAFDNLCYAVNGNESVRGIVLALLASVFIELFVSFCHNNLPRISGRLLLRRPQPLRLFRYRCNRHGRKPLR